MTGIFNQIYGVMQNFFVSLQIKDIFDMLVVFLLSYLILVLLRRTKSYFILDGIILFFAIFLVAKFFNFYLTGLVFQYFFTFFIVIFVVIFQKELRSFFEWISVRGRLRKSIRQNKTTFESMIDVVAKSVEYLSRNKIGALIVFPGKQPIDRLLEGGNILNGKISFPLILSIFDPTSPGHDGAVLIEGDRLKKFSLHLPLAEHIEKLNNVGTRHRSALGLAERSDALVVVVSEERGSISIAHLGNLKVLSGVGELVMELEKFFKYESMISVKKPWYRFFTEHILEKVLAILFTFFLWFTFVFQLGHINQEVSVPIEFRFLPKELVVDEVSPQDVLLTLSGRSSDFNLLKIGQEEIKVIVDTTGMPEGWNKVKLEEDAIQMPNKSISILDFSPKTIRFHITKTIETK